MLFDACTAPTRLRLTLESPPTIAAGERRASVRALTVARMCQVVLFEQTAALQPTVPAGSLEKARSVGSRARGQMQF